MKSQKVRPSAKQNKGSEKQVAKANKKDADYTKYYLPFILILTAIVFSDTLQNSFILNWDDADIIINNNIIKHLDWNSFKLIFTNFKGTDFPLTILTFSLENKFFGLNPFYFHLTNYILHLLNVMLVYFFIRKFTDKHFIAFIVSLLFAIHPMHVESVAWAVERKDVLYSFFFLLSLNSYCSFRILLKKNRYLIWAFIWFIFSLLSKPAAVSLPIVSLAFGIIAYTAQKSIGVVTNNLDYTILARIFMFTYSAMFYIIKAFTPFNLSVIHYYPQNNGNALPIEYYLSLPAMLMLIWAIFKTKVLRNEIIFGLLFYFVTILIVLQIIPFGRTIVCERYSYIPYIGIFFIIGHFLSYMQESTISFNKKIYTFSIISLIAVTLLFSFLSYERNKIWKNDLVLFSDVVKKSPEEGFGWYILGNCNYGNKDYISSLKNYNKSYLLGFKEVELFFNRGLVESKLGNYKEALCNYNHAVTIENKNSLTYFHRGTFYNEIGNFKNALKDLDMAVKLNSKASGAFVNRGITLRSLGRNDESLSDFNQAIALDVYNSEAWFNRATLKLVSGKFDNALPDFSEAISLNPDYFEAYSNRGAAYAYLKRMDNSLRDFNKAIEINPNSAEAYFSRGFTKLSLKDKDGACGDWSVSLRLGYANAGNALNTYCK
jgi:tetratricopeptide (TPR) repeat protein